MFTRNHYYRLQFNQIKVPKNWNKTLLNWFAINFLRSIYSYFSSYIILSSFLSLVSDSSFSEFLKILSKSVQDKSKIFI